MNTAITAYHAVPWSHILGWFANLVTGIRWGLEMHRRYDSEVAAGRRPDDEAMRRISGEVNAWLGRQT